MSRNPHDTGSAEAAAAITTSDTVGFSECAAIYVGVGGTIVALINGAAVTFLNAQSGSILPIRATRVNATGTTATNLVALY